MYRFPRIVYVYIFSPIRFFPPVQVSKVQVWMNAKVFVNFGGFMFKHKEQDPAMKAVSE
jgi:hypothetical protein